MEPFHGQHNLHRSILVLPPPRRLLLQSPNQQTHSHPSAVRIHLYRRTHLPKLLNNRQHQRRDRMLLLPKVCLRVYPSARAFLYLLPEAVVVLVGAGEAYISEEEVGFRVDRTARTAAVV